MNYRKYIILIFHIAVQIFVNFLKTTFVLIESCLNQCTLVTPVIIILLSLSLGMLAERMFYLVYTILYIKITVCSVFLRIGCLLGHVGDLIIHNTTIGLPQKNSKLWHQVHPNLSHRKSAALGNLISTALR